MYFRILVNKNGAPFFRTSKLHGEADMLAAVRLLRSGFNPIITGFDYDLQVLCVDHGEGEIVPEDKIAKLQHLADGLAAPQWYGVMADEKAAVLASTTSPATGTDPDSQ